MEVTNAARTMLSCFSFFSVQGQKLQRNEITWRQWNRESIVIEGNRVRSLRAEEGFVGPALAVHHMWVHLPSHRHRCLHPHPPSPCLAFVLRVKHHCK